MTKKKINIKSVTSDVPSGDVNISYKNVRIAGLSESTTAVLETEDTICEDDIEVEYTKPQSTISMPVYTLNTRFASTPSLLSTYTGAPGIVQSFTLPGSIERIESVVACDINDTDETNVIPFLVDTNKEGDKLAIITTFDPATVNSTYNSIVIRYLPEA